eukprot:5691222-Pyramimonas_sp.AAC.1
MSAAGAVSSSAIAHAILAFSRALSRSRFSISCPLNHGSWALAALRPNISTPACLQMAHSCGQLSGWGAWRSNSVTRRANLAWFSFAVAEGPDIAA